ncbi:MAG: TonB-dependent receptor [Candidatus Cloacimonadota bacterium]|nr:TonB-dependent receptor [Candidatus Cloacimonadota bacterium]
MKNSRQFISFKFQVSSFKFQVANHLKVWSALVFILILIAPSICSAEIRGRVISQRDNTAIPFAKVEFLLHNQITLSNQNGYFVLENKGEKGKLRISSIGYKTETIKITPEMTKGIVMKLKIEPIEISGISVKGERMGSLTYLTNNVEIVDLNEQNSANLFDALESAAGVVIHKNLGGEKTISLNGCNARQIGVMIDGVKVNVGGSAFNIGQIPLEMVNKIEIVSGNASAISGDSSLGGIVNFILKHPEKTGSGNSFIFGVGSWESYKGNYLGKFNLENTSLLVNISTEKSKNDFKYYNITEHKKIGRSNNDFFNRSLVIKTQTKLSTKITGTFSFLLQNADKGIPGQTTDYMWYGNATAFAKLYNFKNELNFDFKNSKLNFRNFYQIQKSHFKNLEADIFHQYHSKNQTNLFETEIGWELFKKSFNNHFKIGCRVESYKFDNLLETSLEQSIPKKYRKFIYLSNSSKLSTRNRIFEIDFIPNMRLDNIIDDKTRYSTKLGLEITPKFVTNLSFAVNFGNSYRMPEFTSLFWKGDSRVKGNPDLQPEKSKGLNGEIKWNPDFMEFTLSGFINRIEGLIYWYRSAMGIWKPDNLADTQISGISGKINLPICDWLSLSSTATRFYPINKTRDSDHYNNYLLYRSLYKVHNCLNIKISKFGLSFDTNHIGEQYDNFSNTVKLKGYQTFDLSCNFSQRINNHFILDLTFWLKNLLDEEYELYRHIPASGRNYEAKLQIKYK